jgi:hypothetical protein
MSLSMSLPFSLPLIVTLPLPTSKAPVSIIITFFRSVSLTLMLRRLPKALRLAGGGGVRAGVTGGFSTMIMERSSGSSLSVMPIVWPMIGGRGFEVEGDVVADEVLEVKTSAIGDPICEALFWF